MTIDEDFCRKTARYFRIEGYDHEDLVQEAMLAWWRTGRTDNYARKSVWNRLRDLARQCREPYLDNGDQPDWVEDENQKTHDPYDNVVRLLDICIALKTLTTKERENLAASLEGRPADRFLVSNARIKLRKALAA